MAPNPIDPQRTKRTSRRKPSVKKDATNIEETTSTDDDDRTQPQAALPRVTEKPTHTEVIDVDALSDGDPPIISGPTTLGDEDVQDLGNDALDGDVNGIEESNARLKISFFGCGLLYTTNWSSSRLSFAPWNPPSEGLKVSTWIRDFHAGNIDPFSLQHIIPTIVQKDQLLQSPSPHPFIKPDGLPTYHPGDIQGKLVFANGEDRYLAALEASKRFNGVQDMKFHALRVLEEHQDDNGINATWNSLYEALEQRQASCCWVLAFFDKSKLTDLDFRRLETMKLDHLLMIWDRTQLDYELSGAKRQTGRKGRRWMTGPLVEWNNSKQILYPRLVRELLRLALEFELQFVKSNILSGTWLSNEVVGVFGSMYGHIFSQDSDTLLQIVVLDPERPALPALNDVIRTFTVTLNSTATSTDKTNARQRLIRWKNQLQKGPRSRSDVWTPLMPELDKLFLKHYKNASLIGSNSEAASLAICEYVNEWVDFATIYCIGLGVSTDVIATRGMIALCPLFDDFGNSESNPRPLLSPAQSLGVLQSLEYQRNAFLEVFRWFEPLVDVASAIEGGDASTAIIILIQRLAPSGHQGLTALNIAEELFSFILSQHAAINELETILRNPMYEIYRVQGLESSAQVERFIKEHQDDVKTLLEFIVEPNYSPDTTLPLGGLAARGTLSRPPVQYSQRTEMAARLVNAEIMAMTFRPRTLSPTILSFRQSTERFLSARVPKGFKFWDNITKPLSPYSNVLSNQNRDTIQLQRELENDDQSNLQTWMSTLDTSPFCETVGGRQVLDQEAYDAINVLLKVSEEINARRRYAILNQVPTAMPSFKGTVTTPIKFDLKGVADVDEVFETGTPRHLRSWVTITRSDRLDVDARYGLQYRNSRLTNEVDDGTQSVVRKAHGSGKEQPVHASTASDKRKLNETVDLSTALPRTEDVLVSNVLGLSLEEEVQRNKAKQVPSPTPAFTSEVLKSPKTAGSSSSSREVITTSSETGLEQCINSEQSKETRPRLGQRIFQFPANTPRSVGKHKLPKLRFTTRNDESPKTDERPKKRARGDSVSDVEMN